MDHSDQFGDSPGDTIKPLRGQAEAYRYELKLTCGSAQLAQARNWIRLHSEGFQIAFPPRQVNNLYLDTAALDSFNANLAGDNVRRKLRLRWYGPLDSELVVAPVLELKSKRDMLGAKSRQTIDGELDLGQPFHRVLAVVRKRAGRAWQFWLQIMNQPVLLNRYRREYYVTPDGLVRATLDYDLAAFDQRLVVQAGWRWPIPLTDTVVIEIKAELAQAERLKDIMGKFPIARRRNSKYVNSLQRAI